MSTSFPSFTPQTSNCLWFDVSGQRNTEKELCELEAKYKNWMESIIGKDHDTQYIGKKTDAMVISEQEPEDQSEESEDEEDTNGFQDSPDEQNPGLQGDIDMEVVGDGEDSTWMI